MYRVHTWKISTTLYNHILTHKEGNILQELMVVWLAQGPPFTGNVDVTKSFFFFFTQCTAVLEWMVLMCHTIPCKDKMFFKKKKSNRATICDPPFKWIKTQVDKVVFLKSKLKGSILLTSSSSYVHVRCTFTYFITKQYSYFSYRGSWFVILSLVFRGVRNV